MIIRSRSSLLYLRDSDYQYYMSPTRQHDSLALFAYVNFTLSDVKSRANRERDEMNARRALPLINVNQHQVRL